MSRRLALAALAALFLAGRSAADAPAKACETRVFEGSTFIACKYQPGEDQLRLMLNGPGGPIGGFRALRAQLGPDAANVAYAMNGGMYEFDQSPVGLLVLDGHEVKRADRGTGDGGDFHLLPNGVFSVDAQGDVRIDETGAFVARNAKVRWATQSGPLLVSHGVLHPKLAPDGSSRQVRNGVGVASPTLAWFVISDGPVSLGRFARFFRDGLRCPDALYLDGHISALWAPELGRMDKATGLGPLVVVMRKGAD